ncbi:uncharacterized protein CC84DRAFT_1140196 [Paraphaeosphaeria sporulosa]|uniref:Zn(2)-C6 fungal-type domain-containing protein n=1 Tax=Paraphaeosphaeria sporulosa TaxID=1460663 RepID=A0A177CM25_9PLEO|nr:uncharacterized protein CC84DRAFT_1140196 [Paraphaeosphaeria sporulosa]OAG07859.1 hypothetical protein CC84DRAFT_1140196 [Paraphaeosphaeria sporulosa]
MRVAKACIQCRAAKRRCRPIEQDGHRPCQQCQYKRVPCSLQYVHAQGPARSIPRPLVSRESRQVLPETLAIELVDLYLATLHGKPHTLFHPAKLRQRVHEQKLPDRVLFGIAGLAARFHPSPAVRERKFEFMKLANASLKSHIDDFGLDTLQACMLVSHLYSAENDRDVESLFIAVAFRIAHIIRLPERDPQDRAAITHEERIRAFWSLYMTDRWSSAGLNVPKQMPDVYDSSVPYPMNETDFYSISSSTSYDPLSTRREGLWAQMVKLARIFGEVQDLHKKHADGRLVLGDVELFTLQLTEDIEAFCRDLPADYHMNETNLTRIARDGLGGDFVALHLGLYHYSTLLTFPFLDLQLSNSLYQTPWANRCKKNAAALSDLLSLSKRVPGCKAVYFAVAHMTVVSSAALLHELLFGNEDNSSITRQRLNANFEVLVELRDLWPAAEMMTDRLFTFQNMCLRSADPNTHRADPWMVKFLLQHSFPIDPKHAGASAQGNSVVTATRERQVNDALSILRR